MNKGNGINPISRSSSDRFRRSSQWLAVAIVAFSGFILSKAAGARIAPPVATPVPSHYDLTLTEGSFKSPDPAVTQPVPQIEINGGFPGPNLVLRQGQAVTITVHNRLSRESSIHWHGLLIPPPMDGAPGFNGFKAIAAGVSFTYKFTPRHSGTYWYHSHTGLQEQEGLYGAITILPPVVKSPTQPNSSSNSSNSSDREFVAVISDRFAVTAEQGLARSLANAAAMGKMQTMTEAVPPEANTAAADAADAADSHDGHGMTSGDSLDPMLRAMTLDLADAQGLEFLINGEAAANPQQFIYADGERLRLRLVNAAGNSIFDLWVQDLPMTIVAVDGLEVKPVTVDELRFMPGQTYDILVSPTGGRAYPLIADSIDRSGRAVAVITPQEGLAFTLPPPRAKTELSADDFSNQFVEKMGWTPVRSAKGSDHSSAGTADMAEMAGMDDMAEMAGMAGYGYHGRNGRDVRNRRNGRDGRHVRNRRNGWDGRDGRDGAILDRRFQKSPSNNQQPRLELRRYPNRQEIPR